MIQALFRFYCRNSSNFCIVFLENLRHQKVILKLTDIYGLDIETERGFLIEQLRAICIPAGTMHTDTWVYKKSKY